MARRLQPTLMDYVVIAINPALIMVLIGSLVYFLLEMFYQGQYPERLHFCLTMFVFAAVLIARISMEEGWDHAAPFGAALAIVICMAMHQFVSYEGRSFAAIGWAINYALIGLTWWCAIQLTWDCTLMDETQDASGEGLLQTVGLDQGDEESESKDESKPEVAAEVDVPAKAEAGVGTSKPASDSNFEDDMAWSTQGKAAKKQTKVTAKPKKTPGEKSRWDKFLERRRRPHAPGVWVVYFSLAALPIFGFGQAFIPVSNTGSRRYAFALLCVYVATALGLLLTTSFLGLRRYLRQRRLEMPAAMAGTWLVTGAVLIIGLLVLTMLLPRPNAEYSISQLPLEAESSEHDSSQLAMGKEGTRDQQATEGTGQRSQPELEKHEGDQSEKGSGQDTSRSSQPGKSERESDKGPGAKSEEQKSGDSSNREQSKSSDGEKSRGSEESKAEQQQSTAANKSKGESSQAKEDASKSQGQASQSQAETSQPSNPVRMPELSLSFTGLSAILKWVFYGALALIVLWWSWNHRQQLLEWLQALLNDWRDLWGLLGKQKPTKEVVPPAPRHRSFYDYTDPFAVGTTGQYPAAELIRYTFEAFEAWAHDQGWPRDVDQTANEFARRVGGQVPDIAKPARTLAELYSRAAYAPGTLPAASAEHLKTMWEVMRQRQPLSV